MAVPLLIAMALVLCVTSTDSASPEAEALLKWKTTLSPSSIFSSWSEPNAKNICNWKGIRCSSSSSKTPTITEINLSSNDISGTLAQFNFSAFPTLQKLNLSNNLLEGAIPPEIRHLNQIQSLDLYNNLNINGSIPFQITNLQKLTHLDLGGKSPEACLVGYNFLKISNAGCLGFQTFSYFSMPPHFMCAISISVFEVDERQTYGLVVPLSLGENKIDGWWRREGLAVKP